MSFSQKIKEEVTKSILKIDLEESSLEIIDDALKSILEKYSSIINLHDAVLNNENLLSQFKDLIIAEIKKGDDNV